MSAPTLRLVRRNRPHRWSEAELKALAREASAGWESLDKFIERAEQLDADCTMGARTRNIGQPTGLHHPAPVPYRASIVEAVSSTSGTVDGEVTPRRSLAGVGLPFDSVARRCHESTVPLVVEAAQEIPQRGAAGRILAAVGRSRAAVPHVFRDLLHGALLMAAVVLAWVGVLYGRESILEWWASFVVTPELLLALSGLISVGLLLALGLHIEQVYEEGRVTPKRGFDE